MNQTEFEPIWDGVLSDLRQNRTKTVFDLWFSELKLEEITPDGVIISCPSETKKNIIANKYAVEIEKSLSEQLGFSVTAKFICNSPAPPTQIFTPYQTAATQTSVRPPENPVGSERKKLSSNADFTFETFVVGESNKFAHAVALAVATQPFSKYNPLFIYGSSGLGKTHLLYAIMNEMGRRDAALNIIYVKGEEFTNEMIASIREKSQPSFRAKYRNADILLIDDIQFIAGKEGVQEEFFHTFNALFEDNKQIILVADRPPKDMKTLEDRLRTRFEWGLIADIQIPDYELRIAIMQKKAKLIGINLPKDVTVFLAENLRSNIRQLEGAIKKIAASAFLGGVPITVELAKNTVNELLISNEPIDVTVERIIGRAATKYGVDADDIKGRNKTKEVASVRHICVYLIRKLTGMSFPNIGKLFERDHSTIMNSYGIIESQIKQSPMFELEINELINEIKN